MKIKTSHDYPPIPTRDADWSAVTDDYDWAPDGKDHPIGRGRTEQDAINDLVEQLVTEAFEDGYMTALRDARTEPPARDTVEKHCGSCGGTILDPTCAECGRRGEPQPGGTL